MFTKRHLRYIRNDFKCFEDIYNFVKTYSAKEIIELCVTEVYYQKEKKSKNCYTLKDSSDMAKNMSIGCFITPFVGYASVADFVMDLKQNLEEYRWINERLSDQISQKTFFGILRYRLFLNKKDLIAVVEPTMQYFIPNLLPEHEDAVYVDCGTFDGQTVKDFISVYGTYSKIYSYEPAVDNYKNCCETLQGVPNLEIRNKGLSNEEGSMRFTSHMHEAANRINPGGDIIVSITTLDEDIKEAITFIKMDIEGAEQAALIGAKKHISQDMPQMAVCLYHTIQDIWKIPRIIEKISPGYRFYMRYHEVPDFAPEEIVLYADPVETDNCIIGKKSAVQNQIKEAIETINEAIDYIEENIQNKKIRREIILDLWGNIPLFMEGLIPLIESDMSDSVVRESKLVHKSCKASFEDINTLLSAGALAEAKDIFKAQCAVPFRQMCQNLIFKR